MGRFQLISRFRFQSILTQTILLLLLFAVTVTGGVCWVVGGMIVEEYQRSTYQNSLSLLNKISGSFRDTLGQIEVRMNEVLQSSSTGSLLVAPERQDFERTWNTVAMLRELCGGMTVSSCLYIYQSDQVLCSDEEILPLEQYADQEALRYFRENAAGEAGATLLSREGRIWLALPYPKYKNLGLLVLELDPNAVYETLVRGIQDPVRSNVFFYDQEQQGVLTQYTGTLSEEELEVSECLYQDGQQYVFRCAQEGGTVLCLVRDADSGWYYVAQLQKPDELAAVRQSAASLVPLALLLLLLVAALAYYIFHSIYRPIEKLVLSMAMPSSPRPLEEVSPKGNELDYIHSAYEDARRQSLELSKTLSQVSPAVITHVFQGLLRNEYQEREVVEEKLRALAPSFPEQYCCWVLIVKAIPDRGAMSHDMDRTMYLLCLRQWTKAWWEGKCFCQVLEPSGDEAACVLCADSALQPLPINICLEQYTKAMLHQAKGLPFTPMTACSRGTDSILKLSGAYQQAQKNLLYQQYCHASSQSGETQASAELETLYEQVRQIIRCAVDGSLKQAQTYTAAFHQDLQMSVDLERVKTPLQNYIIEQALEAQVDIERQDIPSDPAALLELLLPRFQQCGKNSRYRYLSHAKKYIEDHYMDSSLSLDEVSGYARISAPYLSTLFSEELRQSFVDYLRQYRVQKALRLLETTDYTVAEVGFKTGFNSSNNFIRVFKKVMGVTPGKFREDARNRESPRKRSDTQ